MSDGRTTYGVLGPLSVRRDGGNVTPTTPKLQALLTLLLLHHNRVVQIPELIEELWGDGPPHSAASTVQTYVYKLRRILGGDNVLLTRSRGYQLRIAPDDLDLCRFERLSEQGRRMLARGDAAGARTTLAEALSWWRGPALAGAAPGGSLAAHAMRLEERRLTTLEWRIEAELGLGRHREVITELRRLSADHPTHEGLTHKLMTALSHSGLGREAAEVYRRVRRTLAGELGLEPSEALRRLYLALDDDGADGRDGSGGRGAGGGRPPGAGSAPRSAPPGGLRPPPVPDPFVGRRGDRGTAVGMLLEHGEAAVATPIVALAGMPGIGKTALAAEITRRVARRFRGGTLFVPLGGSGPDPMPVDAALERMLCALGVPSRQLPAETAERSALLRTVLERRRTLLVLDDVASAADARLLLPGCPLSAVLVTGRVPLYGLAGARVLRLDGLSRDDLVRLLAAAGRRGQGERRGMERLARLCAGSPLTAHAIAGRLREDPSLPAGALADRLLGARRPLDELGAGGERLRALCASMYARLSEDERAAVRRLAELEPGPATVADAARALGTDERAAEAIVAVAAEHCFLVITGYTGEGRMRYQFAAFAYAFLAEYFG
ncbi:AfsR/SARP family transcriptional regulator [Actinomadura rifamycini]|uniref:AfsR/SARP family transcriptional regulator n=1 Tax=Actinomadura rifamycini TaxID=31962 RepID=UPI000A02A136|nr:AfsR/SARP family transcriptional regulator [Actinomadura rifamycini]